MRKITDETRKEVSAIVYEFFADECEVELDKVNDETDIFQDLNGDSLMFLELIEVFKKKYDLNIDLKTIGKYNVKHPVRSVGELIRTQLLIIEHENAILELD